MFIGAEVLSFLPYCYLVTVAVEEFLNLALKKDICDKVERFLIIKINQTILFDDRIIVTRFYFRSVN